MKENKSLVLVVDDQPEITRVVRIILEDGGYAVWTATNGQHAIERLEAALRRRRKQSVWGDSFKYLPDLIISDILMPVMDGYEFYDWTRRHPALNHIPFIFLSAKGGDVEIRRGKELGADDYLTKPLTPEDLLSSVRGKLRRVSQRRALMRQFVGDASKPPVLGILLLGAFVLLIIIVTVIVTLILSG